MFEQKSQKFELRFEFLIILGSDETFDKLAICTQMTSCMHHNSTISVFWDDLGGSAMTSDALGWILG